MMRLSMTLPLLLMLMCRSPNNDRPVEGLKSPSMGNRSLTAYEDGGASATTSQGPRNAVDGATIDASIDASTVCAEELQVIRFVEHWNKEINTITERSWELPQWSRKLAVNKKLSHALDASEGVSLIVIVGEHACIKAAGIVTDKVSGNVGSLVGWLTLLKVLFPRKHDRLKKVFTELHLDQPGLQNRDVVFDGWVVSFREGPTLNAFSVHPDNAAWAGVFLGE